MRTFIWLHTFLMSCYQETRSKDLGDAFDSGVDGLTADTSSPSQVSSLLWFPGTSRAHSSGAIHQSATGNAVRQNIYENFMRELETGTGWGGPGSGDRPDPSTGTEEGGESSSESAEGSLEELDLLFEKEQGVVRRAGWLAFKPLVTLHKDRKLELVTRRKWKQYWVTLKGRLGGGVGWGGGRTRAHSALRSSLQAVRCSSTRPTAEAPRSRSCPPATASWPRTAWSRPSPSTPRRRTSSASATRTATSTSSRYRLRFCSLARFSG